MKMKTVYEANPALGDPMSIEGQLTENGHRLDKLRADVRRYQGFLDEVEGKGGSASPAESLSRSASDSSVNHNKTGMAASLTSQARSSNSPESGLGLSHLSLQGGGCETFRDIDAEEEFYESDPLPVLGRCRAVYTFEASSEGSIPMKEGEELWLIETDQGDGWTRVRRLDPSHLDPMPEGFVPTSYIDTTQMFPVPHPV